MGIELGIGWFALGLVVVLGTLASIAVVRRYRRRATGHASAEDHGDEGREGQVVDANFETGLSGEAW
jgi:membrane protein implicated in regulation of membrane protease activity